MVVRVLFDGLPFHEGMRGGGIHRYAREVVNRVGRAPGVAAQVYGPRDPAVDRAAATFVVEHRVRENHRLFRWARRANDVAEAVERHTARFRAARPDLIHATYYRVPKAPGRLVVTLYDVLTELYPDEFAGPEFDRLRVRKRAALGRADLVLCISEHTRRDAERLFGVPPTRSVVTYLGSSLTAPAGADQPGDPPVAGPYLMHVGNRWPYKNFHGLLEAYARWPLRHDVRLVSCGGVPGWTAEEQAVIDRDGLGDRVVKLNRVSDDRLAALYTGAVCTVVPSLYEGFGLPVLEAMQCGSPVAVADTSSLPEVAGPVGEYFDPTDPDAIAAALTRAAALTPAERAARVAAGRDRAATFSWDRCAAETLRAYHEVLG